MAVDCITGLKTTKNGNTAIIVAVCAYSKWVLAKAIPNVDSTQTSQFFRDEMLTMFGAPDIVKTDNGPEFRGEF